MIRVLLADDDALVRSGLRVLLGAEGDLDVVGEAATGREAIARARELHPDVVVMDVRMPLLDGVAATREIVSWPHRPRVLVLTTFDLDEVVDDALDAGADGFLLKRATPQQLIDGIRTVFAGDALVAPAVTRRLLAAHARRRAPDRDRLTLAGPVDRTGGGGPAGARGGAQQRRDRRPHVAVGRDRQDAPQEHPGQARGP